MNDAVRAELQRTLGSAYTLERELGGGGMSRVFVADETALKRKVAVKVLAPELAAGVNVERFNREILVAAQLQHPHIVPVLTAGETNGLPYYTMPFVEGESLRARLVRANALSITDAVSVLRDISRALAYAHERGIVHRDIKPDNVLITGGAATVTDFGIAKAISAARTGVAGGTLTQVGTSIGTPVYMSPEQASGDPDTDHRTDLYSFGCVAYEVLSGRPPFVEKTPRKLLAAHMGEKPEPIATLRPDTPPLLADLVMRCLAKEPDERPQTASDVARVLETVTSGSGQPAMAPVLLGGKGMLRRALAIYAVAVGVVAIVARAAIVGIGLPDWVFPGSMIVMALGLPVILWTGYVQRVTRRTLTATPTFTPGGTPSLAAGTMATIAMKASPHVTWRRTALGGAWALGGFAVLVGVFMVMRQAGVGPFASLTSSGKLKAREPILLTDFRVTSGDSSLGRVVSDALREGLSESSVLLLVPPATLAGALQRAGQRPTARIDFGLAQRIALAEGYKAIVDGEVTPIGTGYTVKATLVTADSGRELMTYRATGEGSKGLIDAVGEVARKLRGKAGESLRSVQAGVSLAQATTESLEALRKFSEGTRANLIERDWPKAVRLLREAVAIDSTFASAWRRLGQAMSNLGLPRSQQDSALSRAFQLRNRLPDNERDAVVGAYYAIGPGRDRRKAEQAYEAMIARGDSSVLNNLALRYASRREFARAESLYRASLRIQPALTVYNNLTATLVAQGKLDEADSVLTDAAERFPQSTVPRQQRFSMLYYRKRFGELDRALDSARKVRDANQPSTTTFNAATMSLLRGRVGEWGALDAKAVALDSIVGVMENAAADVAVRTMVDAYVRGRSDSARALDAVLSRAPLRAMPEGERPYHTVARAFAMAGRPDRARAIIAEYHADLRDTARRRSDEPALHRTLGEVALAERRFPDALSEFQRADRAADGPATICMYCLPSDLARVYDAAGEADSAIAHYEHAIAVSAPNRFAALADGLLVPRAHERLGYLYSAKGSRDKARAHFTTFVELWTTADADLQPRVAAARAQIARLGK